MFGVGACGFLLLDLVLEGRRREGIKEGWDGLGVLGMR